MAEIPKIVARQLAVAKAGDHPDANLLSAFVERSLGKRERVQLLEHLAQCNECREIVSLSAVQPSVPGTVSAFPVVSPRWLSWPVLRWAVPMACVLVVGGVLMLRQEQDVRQFATAITDARPAAETRVAAPEKIQKKIAALPVPNSEPKAALLAKQIARRPKTASPAAAAAASSFEMADASTGSPLAEMVPGRAKDALAESQDDQAEDAIGELLPREGSMVPAAAASDGLTSANLIPRWTLSADGTLQRSLDSGTTWQTIAVSSQAIFRALAADGLNIWVGGAGGALFHSSDAGQHWTQVRPAAEGQTIEDDIIGVEFTDSLHGKLTTSSEETWFTADAGQTWRKW
jgi:hypothetical protein